MDTAPKSTPASVYTSIDKRSQIEGASPHRLIDLLLGGLLKEISTIERALENQDIELKGRCTNKAVDILTELRLSLNFEIGGQIASNLDAIYEYMQTTLLNIHSSGDTAELPKLKGMLDDLRTTWQAIAREPEKMRALTNETQLGDSLAFNTAETAGAS